MKRKAREEVLRRALEGGLIDDLLFPGPLNRPPDERLSPSDAEREVAARVRALFGDRDPRVPLTSGRILLRRLADLMIEAGRPHGHVDLLGFRDFARRVGNFSTQASAAWVKSQCRWPSEVEAERARASAEKRERRRRNAK